MKKSSLPVLIEKSTRDDFDAVFIMSASTPDRVQDTIDPKAYPKAIKGLDKLIALFNHDANKIVGFWSQFEAQKDSLVGHIKFYHKDWGSMVKEMLDFGIPLGASIGFQGEGEWNEQGGIAFSAIELLETSIVAVPAHPRAIQQTKSIAQTYGVDYESVVDLTDMFAASGIERDPQLIISNAKAAIEAANKTVRTRT